MSLSNFDTKSNPLGTQNLEKTYLVASDSFAIGQMYANVVLAQPDLDVSKLDAGLATAISAFQARMKANATFVIRKLLPGYITTVADGSNFGGLVDSGLSTGLNPILNAHQDANAAKEAGEIASAIAGQAGKIGVSVNSLNINYQQGAQANDGYVSEYDAHMSETINRLSAAAKQASSEIDSLQEAIAQNIEDIVKGGEELGGAITNLTNGILTKIFGSVDTPKPKAPKPVSSKDEEDEEEEDEEEDEEDEEDEDEDEEDDKPKGDGDKPTVDFTVQAIQAGTAGQTKASAAMQLLTANNQKLAAAYQRMAQENALITIAKVMQVQNKLFLKAYAQLGQSTGQLKDEWATVQSAYSTFGQQIQSTNGQSGTPDLGGSIQGAKALWKALSNQLNYIKTLMAGVS